MRDRSLRNLSLTLLAVGACSGITVMLTVAPLRGLGPWSIGVMNVVYWGLWAALVPLAVRVAGWIRAHAARRVVAVVAHVLAACGCALVHISVFSAFQVALAGVVLGRQITAQRILREIATTQRFAIEWELTMYGAIAVFSYALALQAEGRQREVAVAQLQTSLAEARLVSLQRQIQPHFLFNTLHAVSALVRRDPSTAEAMIERLSHLLRTTFRSGSAAEVRLSDDLATLDDYVAIESAQMRERLSVSFEVDEAVLGAAVPVLLTQPLVENAVRHGLQPRASGGHVRVTARRVAADLHIDIVDDGVGFGGGVPPGTGVGLANTRSRLQQMYGDRHAFTVSEVASGGVHVSVRLPFRSMGEAERRSADSQRRVS